MFEPSMDKIINPIASKLNVPNSNATHVNVLVVGLTIALVALVMIHYRIVGKRGAVKLPPGPIPTFLVGNMNDSPVYEEWHTFTAWAKHFGEIVYLRVFGTQMLILGSYRVANELLNKRGVIYSDRPSTSPMMDM
ncbi:hypothetical protein D9757_011097 [Collybiopsis confluens]|uniref:Cytochrome P450 n=1 Tax=Collybiopsis confluens TaxID=2823264 RepID=A0A8H5GXJ7_9AGAR|nr:hypothetical protein D9757_011097 [Collybiopsis confluens]